MSETMRLLNLHPDGQCIGILRNRFVSYDPGAREFSGSLIAYGCVVEGTGQVSNRRAQDK